MQPVHRRKGEILYFMVAGVAVTLNLKNLQGKLKSYSLWIDLCMSSLPSVVSVLQKQTSLKTLQCATIGKHLQEHWTSATHAIFNN